MDTSISYGDRARVLPRIPPRKPVTVYLMKLPLLLLPLLAASLPAANMPAGKPEDAGMSTERLQRVRESVQRHIDAGEISGAVTLVARRGRIVHYEAHGLMDIESKRPMEKDAIFRIASMSKPITGAAVMMMVEEGKLRLNDHVSKFIPDFKNPRVAVAHRGTTPAKSTSCPRTVNSPSTTSSPTPTA